MNFIIIAVIFFILRIAFDEALIGVAIQCS